MTISSFFVALSCGSFCVSVLLIAGGVILTARDLLRLCAACPA